LSFLASDLSIWQHSTAVNDRRLIRMATIPAPLRDLRRRFRPGFELERTGGGHYRVKDAEGRFVQYQGKNLTLTGTGRTPELAAMETALKSAGVLKDPGERRPPTFTDAAREAARVRLREATRVRQANRAKEAKKLRDRLDAVLKPMGGLDVEGRATDLAKIAAHEFAGELPQGRGGRHVTPDLLYMSAKRVIDGGWVETRYQDVWNRLAEQLEKAVEPVGEWYSLVRAARGLPDDVVDVKKPAKGDWPFTVELIPVQYLIVDHAYQRPVPWDFVRKLAATYDESLVGTIDVARRAPSRFAILDGQLRYEATKLVGKNTVWASVYAGLDLQSEARFFLHKNKDRKAIHPYYTFRARVASGDPDAVETERIVNECGYHISLSAVKADSPTETVIQAVAAVEEGYKRKRPDGTPALVPALQTMRATTRGRPQGNSALLIRGLSMVFESADNGVVDPKMMQEVMLELGPELILGRARDLSRSSGGNMAYSVAKVITAAYNRRTPRGENLRLF
jgi:hypothetical protein